MSTITDNSTEEFFRPKNNAEALQVAIKRWLKFQYRVWDQEAKRTSQWLSAGAGFLRVVIIILAGSLTAMSSLDGVDRNVITIVSGVLTILTGLEGYFKLADRKATAENRRAAVLAEFDRQGYEWMAKVELETDTDKALQEAKQFCPNSINDIVTRYVARQLGDKPTEASNP
ncbi:hypothetical protein FBR01_01170 [Anaerolineae bacterium CFX8]|nr:hypothetical protein [Anaerolineae bacterium CFX8]